MNGRKEELNGKNEDIVSFRMFAWAFCIFVFIFFLSCAVFFFVPKPILKLFPKEWTKIAYVHERIFAATWDSRTLAMADVNFLAVNHLDIGVLWTREGTRKMKKKTKNENVWPNPNKDSLFFSVSRKLMRASLRKRRKGRKRLKLWHIHERNQSLAQHKRRWRQNRSEKPSFERINFWNFCLLWNRLQWDHSFCLLLALAISGDGVLGALKLTSSRKRVAIDEVFDYSTFRLHWILPSTFHEAHERQTMEWKAVDEWITSSNEKKNPTKNRKVKKKNVYFIFQLNQNLKTAFLVRWFCFSSSFSSVEKYCLCVRVHEKHKIESIASFVCAKCLQPGEIYENRFRYIWFT